MSTLREYPSVCHSESGHSLHVLSTLHQIAPASVSSMFSIKSTMDVRGGAPVLALLVGGLHEHVSFLAKLLHFSLALKKTALSAPSSTEAARGLVNSLWDQSALSRFFWSFPI